MLRRIGSPPGGGEGGAQSPVVAAGGVGAGGLRDGSPRAGAPSASGSRDAPPGRGPAGSFRGRGRVSVGQLGVRLPCRGTASRSTTTRVIRPAATSPRPSLTDTRNVSRRPSTDSSVGLGLHLAADGGRGEVVELDPVPDARRPLGRAGPATASTVASSASGPPAVSRARGRRRCRARARCRRRSDHRRGRRYESGFQGHGLPYAPRCPTRRPVIIRRNGRCTRALRGGGDFAEVFAEDRRSSNARFDDGKVEELVSGRDAGRRACVWCAARPPDTRTPPTSPRPDCAKRPRPRGRGGSRWRRRARSSRCQRRDAAATHDVTVAARGRGEGAARSSCCAAPTTRPGHAATRSAR